MYLFRYKAAGAEDFASRPSGADRDVDIGDARDFCLKIVDDLDGGGLLWFIFHSCS